MNWSPNRWIAAILGLLFGPLGGLYAAAPRGALMMFGATAAMIVLVFYSRDIGASYSAPLPSVILAIGCAAFSFHLASCRKNLPVRPRYSRWYGLIGICVAFMMSISLVRVFLVEPFQAPSTSMAPTVPKGSYIAVQKWGFGHFSTYGINLGSRPHSSASGQGDIIVFDYPVDPSTTYIKRIVGVAGDTVTYRGGHLFVNGVDTRIRQLDDYRVAGDPEVSDRFLERLNGKDFEIIQRKENALGYPPHGKFAFDDMCSSDAQMMTCKVPAHNYFVLGDNRDNSLDSRVWGFVRADAVVGKVIGIY